MKKSINKSLMGIYSPMSINKMLFFSGAFDPFMRLYRTHSLHRCFSTSLPFSPSGKEGFDVGLKRLRGSIVKLKIR